MARNRDNLGNRVGPRVAKVVTDAMAAHQVRTGPHRRRLFMQMQEDFFSLTGSEVRATLGPLLEAVAEDPDLAPEVRPILQFLTKGHGQWQTLLAHAVAGNALQVGLGALINNAMAPAIGKVISESPRGNLDPSTFAAGVASGRITPPEGARGAAFGGIRAEYFDLLVELAQTQLPPSVVLDLVNRGTLTAAEAHGALRFAGMDDEVIAAYLTTRRQLLSPAVAADSVIRGILTEAEGATIAGQSGMDAKDFATLTLDTGEAPALQTLLEAYRRGIIDDARLEHGIRTGRLRNEWFDVAKALRYAPVSPAEAITGAVEGHLDQGKARNLAEQAGLDPANFDWLFQTHGEPIAVGQAIELWRRGKMAQSEVEQVVRESRTKTKYVPAVLELRRHILPERTVASMYAKGAFTKAEATDRLRWFGVGDDDIAALLKEQGHTRTAHIRTLSESAVLALHADHAITDAVATAHLLALGYAQADVDLILALQRLQTQRRLQASAIAVVRNRYIARHITATAAATALDAAQVASDERDHLMALWALERETTRRLPTVAELAAAVKAGALDGAAFAGRLIDLGYDEADVPVIAAAHKVSMGG